MQARAYFIFAYAALVIGGGILGYLKAGSIASLLMGSAFGLLLLLCGWATQLRSKLALTSATALAALLALFFAYRLILTGSFMPAGMMVILSALVIYLINRRN